MNKWVLPVIVAALALTNTMALDEAAVAEKCPTFCTRESTEF